MRAVYLSQVSSLLEGLHTGTISQIQRECVRTGVITEQTDGHDQVLVVSYGSHFERTLLTCMC